MGFLDALGRLVGGEYAETGRFCSEVGLGCLVGDV